MFKLDLSIVIPLFNEEESLPELTDWIARVMERESFSYEIIFVNDGSTDGSWSVIEGLRQRNPNVKAISFRKNQGKSAGLNQGFKACTGEVVVTMDADLQDSPEELPELRRMILEDHYDLVSGWKQKRYDPITKTLPTKLFNAATRRISKIKLNDFNCGLKAYRLEVVQNVEIYGEM
ncbi:MAG: glycosyltransferase family 2 protein, partial [Schleiferiaceae bacterium]|nr:glycosyltransferase family 2 protein [Schleiferiaceae bacterium]